MELFKTAANATVGLLFGTHESTYTGVPDNWYEQAEFERILDYGFDFRPKDGTLYNGKIKVIPDYIVTQPTNNGKKLNPDDDFVMVERPIV
jgi:hypothetical protein